MSNQPGSRKLKQTESLVVSANGRTVGELYRVQAKGIYFTYDNAWLGAGFNLSPFMMNFDERPQLARDNLFRGLHGPFADSLPDGWGLRLMDRFFNSHFAEGTSLTLTQLNRLAYLGERGMGAFEYQPKAEQVQSEHTLSISRLFEASIEVQAGETTQVLKSLRIAGGSPGGARPKAVVALSADGTHATSAFDSLTDGHEHYIVKFRALDEPQETGAIEQAYAVMARQAGVTMAESRLLDVSMPSGQSERFFASKRFDRQGDHKRHMMTASALVHADFRTPSLDYSELLKVTNALTKSAHEVEKMARLMVFNALSHNYDDHAKNFAFLYNEAQTEGESGRWVLAPAYDLTFSQGMGEHSTAFAGRGKPTCKLINALCKDYPYLKPDEYIDQTLAALSSWKTVFAGLAIDLSAGKGLFRVLSDVRSTFLSDNG